MNTVDRVIESLNLRHDLGACKFNSWTQDITNVFLFSTTTNRVRVVLISGFEMRAKGAGWVFARIAEATVSLRLDCDRHLEFGLGH